MTVRPTWVALVLVAASCARSAPPEAGEAPSPAPVTCAAAASQPIAPEIAVRGVVAPPPRADAVLSSMVAGRVTDLRVEIGDRVTAGQLVARVEDPALPAGTAEGRAAITAAEAEAVAAEAARARIAELAAQGVASTQELEDAVARAATARASLAAARARAGAAVGAAARAELRAPRAGVVLRIFRRAGEAVDGTPATPILEIADVTALELHAMVPAADLVQLAPGARAAITLDAVPGLAAAGAIAVVAPAVDPATALGEVRIAIEPVAGTRLVVGLTGTAKIALAPHPAVVVPTSALRRGPSGADEVVVCDGMPGAARARITSVEVGVRRGDVTELVRGLAAGDRVVVDHALGLADDQPLAEGPAR